MEWPLKSGRMQEFREVDQAAWFKVSEAARKITKGQLPSSKGYFIVWASKQRAAKILMPLTQIPDSRQAAVTQALCSRSRREAAIA